MYSVFVSSVKYSWPVASKLYHAATDEAQILQLSVSSLLFDGIVMLMRGVATYVGQYLFVQLSITHEETAITFNTWSMTYMQAQCYPGARRLLLHV